ncbi:MAG: J domain-containing protein [Bacteriovoracales bacterium]|nr:J domain-containing protein [Bacteriovoracales bacterium]
MQLLGESYLARLFTAFFVVAVVPYLGSKLFLLLTRNLKRKESADLSNLVQRELRRFGEIRRPIPHQTSQDKTQSFQEGQTLQIYEMKLKALEETGEEKGQIKDIKESIQMFRDAQRGRPYSFKNISLAIEKVARISLPPRGIVQITKLCLKENLFVFSKENREVMSYLEAKNLIMARTILDAFVQDALLESSTVCKRIERSKNKSASLVYLSIQLLILLKSGAGRKGLYESAVQKPKIVYDQFQKLSSRRREKAILSSLRAGGRRYLSPGEVFKMIEAQIEDFEQFKKEFISQKSQEQEQKRRQSKKAKSPRSHGLDEYYEILGCREFDSTGIIKKSYRKLALKNHPDRIINLNEESKSKAHEEFIKIQEAYDEIIKIRKKAS